MEKDERKEWYINHGSRIEKYPPVCTNEEARAYFKDKGLTYKDITSGDILALVLLLNQELKKSNKAGETSVCTMHLSQKISTKYRSNGTLIYCHLYMNSHYFTQRQCISFEESGFIGFAGWADEANLNPIRRAFLRWCDGIAEIKEE